MINEHTIKFGKFIYRWDIEVHERNDFGIGVTQPHDLPLMNYFIGLGFLESTRSNDEFHDFKVTTLGKEILDDYEIYHNL